MNYMDLWQRSRCANIEIEGGTNLPHSKEVEIMERVIHRTNNLYVIQDMKSGNYGVKMYGKLGYYSDGFCFNTKEDAIEWCEEMQEEIDYELAAQGYDQD
jgi:hypothetical protein